MQHNVVRRTPVAARSARLCAALAITGALLAFASPALATPSSTPDATYVTNGTVNAIARLGNTLYLAGRFSQIGPRTGALASLSDASGAPDLALPQVTGGQGEVEAIVSDGHGGEYIAGGFSRVGGVARSNAAHILANDTVDPNWNPDLNSTVYAIALSGNTVYLGGDFNGTDAVNGTLTRNYAAAVDATTGIATSWNPDLSSDVFAIGVSGSIVYLGGYFSGADSVGTATRNYLAAVDATTGAINNSWNPDANGEVNAIAVDGSTVYIGGDFAGSTAIDGAARNYAAAVNATSGALSAWNPDANEEVDSLAVSGSVVYLGGNFEGPDSMNGSVERDGVAAVNATSATVTSWNPGVEGNVYAIDVNGGTVYIGGDFEGSDSAGGQDRDNLAAIDATTGAVSSWNPNANETIDALASNGTNVVAGGDFSSVGGVERDNLAAINAADGTPTAWNPQSSGQVNAIGVIGNTVYLGGEFNTINGTTTRNDAAAVDATTGAVDAWNPNPNGYVNSIAISGNTVYLGGAFNSINGSVTRNYAAAVDGTTGLATAWNPDANARVLALAASGSTVYLGGAFNGANSINGSLTRNYVAAVDSTTGTATAWNPNATSEVLALAVSANTVYIGGYFNGANSIAGVSRNRAAAVDATTGVATAWDPNLDAEVNAIVPDGGVVYIAGNFGGATAINGTVTRDGLAAVDATTGAATAWDPLADSAAFALLVAPDGTVYAGGEFNSFDTVAQSGFASFSEPPANTAVPQITGAPAVGQTLACSTGTWSGSTPQRYAYQWLRDGVAIAGASGSAYILAATDAGQLFSCTVTASNLGATQASATSAAIPVQSVIAGTVKVNKATGAITFTETVSDPGVLHWVLTFQNGKFGVFNAKKHKKTKCKKGKIKLSGKCRSATVVYAQGSVAVTSGGTKTFTVKPNAAGSKALKRALSHHKTLTLTATLSFQSNHGGSPVVHVQTISFKPVKPSKHKHKKHK
jgi:trimeric autotransporter adhesin